MNDNFDYPINYGKNELAPGSYGENGLNRGNGREYNFNLIEPFGGSLPLSPQAQETIYLRRMSYDRKDYEAGQRYAQKVWESQIRVEEYRKKLSINEHFRDSIKIDVALNSVGEIFLIKYWDDPDPNMRPCVMRLLPGIRKVQMTRFYIETPDKPVGGAITWYGGGMELSEEELSPRGFLKGLRKCGHELIVGNNRKMEVASLVFSLLNNMADNRKIYVGAGWVKGENDELQFNAPTKILEALSNCRHYSAQILALLLYVVNAQLLRNMGIRLTKPVCITGDPIMVERVKASFGDMGSTVLDEGMSKKELLNLLNDSRIMMATYTFSGSNASVKTLKTLTNAAYTDQYAGKRIFPVLVVFAEADQLFGGLGKNLISITLKKTSEEFGFTGSVVPSKDNISIIEKLIQRTLEMNDFDLDEIPLIAAACFAYPQVDRLTIDKLVAELHASYDREVSTISKGIDEDVIRNLYAVCTKRRWRICSVYNVNTEIVKNIEDYILFDRGLVYVTDRMFGEVISKLRTRVPIDQIKQECKVSGLTRADSDRYTTKVKLPTGLRIRRIGIYRNILEGYCPGFKDIFDAVANGSPAE